MSSAPLLIEIGTEELPPASLQALGEGLFEEMLARLDTAGIGRGEGRWFATPRRLAVLIDAVAEQQDDSQLERLGPAHSAAFDDSGAPSKAALGFARSCGVEVEQLIDIETPKGLRLGYRVTVPGKPASSLLEEILTGALAALPIAKRMRWGAGREEFVRPPHWLVLLYGTDVVDADVMGLQSGRLTRGHRTHAREPLSIEHPRDYVELLRGAYVVADFAERRELIRLQVQQQAAQLEATAAIDADLLDEVTGLVEWPVAITGHFDTQFLSVPAEALVSSMKSHQKYFHVLDADGKLKPHFIFVANLDSTDADVVRLGNERVIRPRLADADFFYRTDCRVSLESRRERLRKVVFQNDLGSVWEKTERVALVSAACAELLGADVALCRRAAQLSKSDLVSDMVLEFDELQGIMGRYYALNDGESEGLAVALEEQYLPRFAGDRLPQSTTGICLALADRLDTLVGLFGIGQPPTGSKDPFALRRAALGMMRILIENQLALDLRPLLEVSAAAHGQLPDSATVVDEVLTYAFERLRAWYQEDNITAECFHAVAARNVSRPLEFDQRIRAVAQFSKLPEATSLAAANKRVANILAGQEQESPGEVDPQTLLEAAERQLASLLAHKRKQLRPLLDNADFGEALQSLADLKTPVDEFFDTVLVNCEDPALRRNRIALLAGLRQLFLEIADISQLAGLK